MTTDSGAGNGKSTRPLYPGGIPYIVGNEAAERFSYYGMRAILYVYLTSLFVAFRENIPEEEAAAAGAHAASG